LILADEQVGLGINSPFVYTPYNSGTPNPVTISGSTISATGGNQPHTNIQPVIAVTYIIAMYGVYPSPT
jgi:microcystin-dependent protein